MKRNFLSLFALVLAIGVSSFTVRFGTIYYLEFQSGSHNAMGSYKAPTTTQPAVDNGTTSLYWVSVEDINFDAGIQAEEFNAAFPSIDVSTVDNNLNNESERTTTYSLSGFGSGQVRLEKKS